MLVPPEGRPGPLQHINATAFDEKWPFNSPDLRSTRKYGIPKATKPGLDDFGIINDDGIDNVGLFVGSRAEPSRYTIKDCTVIEFPFPEAVKPGQKVQARISFSVAPFGRRVSASALDYEFAYFDFGSYTTECSRLIQTNFVNIHLQPTAGPGGFSILLYSPPGFEKSSGFEGSNESWDRRNPDGIEGEPRTKCVWQMRRLLDLKEAKDFGPEQELVVIRGSFAKRVGDEVVKRLEEIPPQIEGLEQKIRDQAKEIDTQTEQIGREKGGSDSHHSRHH